MTLSTDVVQGMIAAARRDLVDDLAQLTDAQWVTPSLCSAWTIEETVAHLTAAANMTAGRWVRSMVLAGFRADVHNRRRLREHRGATPGETLARFRACVSNSSAPSSHTLGWLGEVVVHSQDIRLPLGLTNTPELEAMTAVAGFFASRNFAVNSKTVAGGLRLEATDGPFVAGDGPVVRGSTTALVMVMAGRGAYLDDVLGDGVATIRGRI